MPLNDLNDYQERAARYDLAAPTCGQLWYYGLGVAGEAGEVADKVKKLYRGGAVLSRQQDLSGLPQVERDELVKELGDVLWYVAAIARMLDVSLSDVAHVNLAKLESRLKRGTVFGTGDNR